MAMATPYCSGNRGKLEYLFSVGSAFRVPGSGCSGFWVQGAGFRVPGSGCRVQGAENLEPRTRGNQPVRHAPGLNFEPSASRLKFVLVMKV